MDLRNLKTFHVVSTYLNFTKAAEILIIASLQLANRLKR